MFLTLCYDDIPPNFDRMLVRALGSLLHVSPLGFPTITSASARRERLDLSDSHTGLHLSRDPRHRSRCRPAALPSRCASRPPGRPVPPPPAPPRALAARTPADRARLSLADVSLTAERVGLTLGLEFLPAVQASCAGQRRDCLPSALFRSLSPALRHPKHGGLLWQTCSGAQHLKD